MSSGHEPTRPVSPSQNLDRSSRVAALRAQLARYQKKISNSAGDSAVPVPDQLASISLAVSKVCQENEQLRAQSASMLHTAEQHEADQVQRSFFGKHAVALEDQRAQLARCNADQEAANAGLSDENAELCSGIAALLTAEDFTDQQLYVPLPCA